MTRYQPRILDAELDALLPGLPAVSIEGPKGVGKTATALQRAAQVLRLDEPAQAQLLAADPSRLSRGPYPLLLDEWQRLPSSWDLVRRAVDDDPSAGRFLLTGSAAPRSAPTHSGAGRIVTLRMRPLTLAERGVAVPTVSLAQLLEGGPTSDLVFGHCKLGLAEYTSQIVAGGFPALRATSERAIRAALDGYLQRIIEVDLPESGAAVRRPETLRRWLSAYAAATSTTASYDRIRDAATAGEGDKPAKSTAGPYRDALERLFVLEPLNAWAPTLHHLSRLSASPKHHLADPALAARLLGMNAAALLRGEGEQVVHRDGALLGGLFESLATLVVRVGAQAAEARVLHFRSWSGEREVDLIVERGDHRVLGLEVTLSPTVDDRDVRHLLWLREQLGADFLGGAVLTTGSDAYLRPDGIAVIPLGLLGP